MGYEGVGFNRQASSDMTKDIEARLRELEAQCFALAKRSFNVRSPQETAAVLCVLSSCGSARHAHAHGCGVGL